jgi:fructokinase
MVENGDGTRRAAPGGGPFNTARALARLGVPTAFLGRLSDDAFGQLLTSQLAGAGASLTLASYGPEPTTIAIANIDEEGLADYQFLVDGTSAPNLTLAMLPGDLPASIRGLHVGTLGLALEPIASTLAELVTRVHQERLVMVDPNVRPGLVPDPYYRSRLMWFMSRSTVVKASSADLDWLFPGVTCEAAARQILGLGVELVLVTLGANGAFGITMDHRAQVDAAKIGLVDTIGAGDAFGAAALAWLDEHDHLNPRLNLERRELRSLLQFACSAAALACTKSGADPPWRSELE